LTPQQTKLPPALGLVRHKINQLAKIGFGFRDTDFHGEVPNNTQSRYVEP
jgi:hypothetical protein